MEEDEDEEEIVQDKHATSFGTQGSPRSLPVVLALELQELSEQSDAESGPPPGWGVGMQV